MTEPQAYGGGKLSRKKAGMEEVIAEAEALLEKHSDILDEDDIEITEVSDSTIAAHVGVRVPDPKDNILKGVERAAIHERDAQVVLLLQ